jgi:glycosyltransferase involved in cell wall biosynthesis
MIAVIYINYGPYHLARIRALARINLNVIGIEVASKEKLRLWRPAKEKLSFKLVTLFEKEFESVPSKKQIKAMQYCLDREKPKVVVIAGYSMPVMRTAARWAKENGAISILMSATWKGDKSRNWVKERIKAILVKRLFDSIFVGGERQLNYIKSLGIATEYIWKGNNVVDNAYFASNALKIKADAEVYLAKLGLPQKYFLYVGRFSPEKNLPRLLKAYQQYRRQGGKWELVLIGEGPQKDELKSLTQKGDILNLHWPGFKQYDELTAYYSLASCLILPSLSEPWGLVANEAMASGLPVLLSNRCGCLPELCHRGINGFDFDPYNIDEITSLMFRISGGEIDLEAFSESSRRIISLYKPETWAQALHDCIKTTIEKKVGHYL